MIPMAAQHADTETKQLDKFDRNGLNFIRFFASMGFEVSLRFSINPAFVWKGPCPFARSNIAGLVPTRCFAPVEEFSEVYPDSGRGAVFEQALGHERLVFAVAHESIVDGRMAAETFGIDIRGGVDVRAAFEEEFENLQLIEIDGDVEQRRAVDGSPVH